MIGSTGGLSSAEDPAQPGSEWNALISAYIGTRPLRTCARQAPIQLRLPRRRTRAGEGSEVQHQMRLIGIAAFVREFGPATAAPAASPDKSEVETRHARHRFGRKSDFVVKLRRQMLAAPSKFGGDRTDALEAASLHQALKRPNRRRGLPIKLQQAIRQERFDDIETLFPIRLTTRPVAQCGSLTSQNVIESNHPASKPVDRQMEEPIGAGWGEVDPDT